MLAHVVLAGVVEPRHTISAPGVKPGLERNALPVDIDYYCYYLYYYYYY